MKTNDIKWIDIGIPLINHTWGDGEWYQIGIDIKID